MKNERPAPKWELRPLLRRADQACCGGLVILSLVTMSICWIYQGGLSGRLIDVEKAERKELRFQLDVNEAELPEWTLLPDIGEMLAERIVESRAAEGPFRSHEDLLRVRGIGPKTLDRIRPYLMPVKKS